MMLDCSIVACINIYIYIYIYIYREREIEREREGERDYAIYYYIMLFSIFNNIT